MGALASSTGKEKQTLYEDRSRKPSNPRNTKFLSKSVILEARHDHSAC